MERIRRAPAEAGSEARHGAVASRSDAARAVSGSSTATNSQRPVRRDHARGQRAVRQGHALEEAADQIEPGLLRPAAHPVALAARHEASRVARSRRAAIRATQIVPGRRAVVWLGTGRRPSAPARRPTPKTRSAPVGHRQGARLGHRAAREHVVGHAEHTPLGIGRVHDRRTEERRRGARHASQPLAHAPARERLGAGEGAAGLARAAAAPSPPTTRRRRRTRGRRGERRPRRRAAPAARAPHRARAPSRSAAPSPRPSTRGRRSSGSPRRRRGRRGARRPPTRRDRRPAAPGTRSRRRRPSTAARAGSCRRPSRASRRGRRAPRRRARRPRARRSAPAPSPVRDDPARALGHGGLPEVALGHRTDRRPPTELLTQHRSRAPRGTPAARPRTRRSHRA